MHRLRILSVLFILLLSITAAQAQTPALTVEPDAGEIGTVFTITANNLSPNTDYTIAFIFVETDTTVFSTARRSNASGELSFNVNSEPSDPSGLYRIELQQGETVVASAEFTLNGEASPEEDEPASTPAAPPTNTGVELRVLPNSAGAGATHSILINGLQPEQTVTLVITNPAGTEVYERSRMAGENGRLTVDIFTSGDDAAGTYTVTVYDTEDNALAQDTFTIEAPIGREGVVAVEPSVVDEITVYTLNISEVKPFADLNVRILSEAGEEVFFTRLRATVEGTAQVEFTPPPDTPAGNYQVSVTEGQIEVAAGTLTIGTNDVVLQAADNINMRVTPVNAPAGTLRIITITGLRPGEDVYINIVRNGRFVGRLSETADVNGNLAVSISNLGEDEPGEYTVVLRRATGIAAETSIQVEAATVAASPPEAQSDVTITIDPPSGPVGTVYNVRVTGLDANETVTIAVQLDGRTIFASERTSNNSGVANLSLTSEEGDAPGTYSVVVLRSGTQLASADFTIGTDTAQPDTAEADVLVRVDPASGTPGTVHTITISDLNPGEEVTINVLFAGETVYSTDRTADNGGTIVLNLAAEATDPTGDYTIQVVQGASILGESVLTVLAAEPDEPPSEASISITPISGTPGTVHRIEISNLEPDETITVEVLFDGETVYTTDKTADSNGIVTLDLAADNTDPAGDYTVNILRDTTVIASSSFTVASASEPDTTEPPPDESAVELTLTPDSGAIGTSHQVRITGLDAGEAITVEVIFNGETVYTTAKTADRAGIVSFNLVTEEGDAEGVYTVQVLRDGEVVAASDLTVSGEAPDSTVVVPPASGDKLLVVEDALADGAAQQAYTFSANQGDIVVITLTSPDFDTYVILQDNTGAELTYNDDIDYESNNYDSAIGPFTLPYSGEYTVIVTSYDALYNNDFVNGRYVLTVETATLQALTLGENTSVEFTESSSTQYFTFDASTGDIISIGVEGGRLDTSLALLDPTGAIVAEDDDGGAGFNPEIVRYVVRETGTYTVILATYVQQDTGTATLVVNSESARQLESTPQTVTITAKQTTDIVVMDGSRDEEVLLNVGVVSGTLGQMSITVYQDDIVLMTYTSQRIPNGTVLGFVIPEDGTVNIIVEDVTGGSNAILELSAR